MIVQGEEISGSVFLRKRDKSIDIYRGILMVIMALDHTVFYIIGSHPMEYFGDGASGFTFPKYEETYIFLNRILSHIVAPGFFFLLGISVVFYKERHNQTESKGLLTAKDTKHFLLRGLIMIILQLTLINFAWMLGTLNSNIIASSIPSGEGGTILISMDVIASLAVCMVLAYFLSGLKSYWIMGLSLVLILVNQIFFPNQYMLNNAYHPLIRWFYIPGQSGAFLSHYPILHWLPLTGFGLVFGRLYTKSKDGAMKVAGITGAGLILAFCLTRFLYIFDQHPQNTGIKGFFSLTKYPPSLSYFLFTMGVGLVMLYFVNKLSGRFLKLNWLRILGENSMAFYIVHLYVYGLIGLVAKRVHGQVCFYLLWIFGLVISYFISKAISIRKKKVNV